MEEYEVMALKPPFRILDIYLKHSIDYATQARDAQSRIAEEASLLRAKAEGLLARLEYKPNNPLYP